MSEEIVLPIGWVIRLANRFLASKCRSERILGLESTAHGQLRLRLSMGSALLKPPEIAGRKLTLHVVSIGLGPMMADIDSFAGRLIWSQIAPKLTRVRGITTKGGLVTVDLAEVWPGWLGELTARAEVAGDRLVLRIVESVPA